MQDNSPQDNLKEGNNSQIEISSDNERSQNQNSLNKLKQPDNYMGLRKVFIVLIFLAIVVAYFLQSNNYDSGQSLALPYDTMGMHKKQQLWNEVVKESEYYRFQQSFFDFLKPYNVLVSAIQDTTCQLERMGDTNDGGYPVCVNYLNHSKGLINLGIEKRDKFGCDLTSRQNMPNFQYDCFNDGKPICVTNNNNNIFTLACLGQKTQKTNYQFFSMKEMIDRGNLTGKNFILKIDIQGAQWQGFKTFPIQYLKLADQILMELHLPAMNYLISLYDGDIFRQ